MAHKTISDDEMMLRALELFRTYGFHGVSLKQLADSMGLEKASLYYRFPGGKDEIALAVVQAVDAGVREKVFQALDKPGVSPKHRVRLACDELRRFYGGGTKSCTLDVMSIPGSTDAIREVLQTTLKDWTDAFARIAMEAGLTPAQARARAEEAIILLEGALVISRVNGIGAAFERVMKQLPKLLTES